MIRVALLLAVVSSAALPAVASAATRSYGGVTRDGQPIVLRVNTATSNVERIGVMFTAKCRSGSGYSFGHALTRRAGAPAEPRVGEFTMRTSKGAGGAFTATAIVFERLLEERLGGVGVKFRGRIRGNAITGTVEAEVAVGSGASGEEPEDTCDYDRVSFRATHAPGRVLTGETSQDLPVVMRLTRRRVSVIRIGWNAGCEPRGFIQIPDELLRFNIRAGAFGDEFDHTVRLDDGTERVFHYDVDGRASRRRASGTIGVEMEDRGGPAPGTCRTGLV
ncbi:MAG TPA: hypothetical protein VGW10_20065, partial [Solirubrobacteraceae bacterium]|nr:hypothetical protein [Solirubrobacteraceae bacterium]